MSDELLRAQINALIRDEIQETVNDYIEENEQQPSEEKGTSLAVAFPLTSVSAAAVANRSLAPFVVGRADQAVVPK